LTLKTLLPEYEGRIKCIYIDPPYNIGNEGWVYNNNVDDLNGGFINHYPDYIVLTKRHKVGVIETKGDDRDNSDSKTKLKLGQAWASKAGNDHFKYFMVFDRNLLDGA
jgi:16S rRNA G966 N2-methylase RsmD